MNALDELSLKSPEKDIENWDDGKEMKRLLLLDLQRSQLAMKERNAGRDLQEGEDPQEASHHF